MEASGNEIVTFQETGLAGQQWSVSISGPVTESQSSTSSTITFNNLVDGSYTWTDSTPIAAGAGAEYISEDPQGGFSPTQGLPLTITIPYDLYYQLSMQANPSGGGNTVPPVGTYWRISGYYTGIEATANSGYSFSGWTGSGSGSYSGPTSGCSGTCIITMNGPITEMANFQQQTTGSLAITIAGLPSSLSVEVSVTGPNGYSALPTITGGATDTLTGLSAGTYTVAGGLGSDGWQPTQASQNVNVNAGQTAGVTITYVQATVTVSQVNLIASPTTQVADGSSQVTLQATVIGSNGLGMSGQSVTFTTTLGTLSATSATTNSGGQATVYLTSNQVGTATVQASSGGVSSTAQSVTFTSSTGSLAITISGLPSSLSVEVSVSGPNGYSALPTIAGGSTDTLTNLVPGTYTVAGGLGANGWQPTQASQTVGLTADQTASVTIQYQQVQVTVSQVNLVAYPTTQTADGNSQVTLQATVIGSNGLGMSGQTVTFTTTLGTLSSSTATTNSGGQATVYLTSTQAGTANVQASSAGISSSVVSATFASATGSLAIAISGLPSSLSVEVSVTGPNGYSALPTIAGSATDTLSGLTPGTYTVAGGLGADGWQPVSGGTQVSVLAGQTASLSIKYQQTTQTGLEIVTQSYSIASTDSTQDHSRADLYISYTVMNTGTTQLPTSGFSLSHSATPSTDPQGGPVTLDCTLSSSTSSSISPGQQATLTFLCGADWYYTPSTGAEISKVISDSAVEGILGLIPVVGAWSSANSDYNLFNSDVQQIESQLGVLVAVSFQTSLSYTTISDLVTQNSFVVTASISQEKLGAITNMLQTYHSIGPVVEGLDTAGAAAYSTAVVLAAACGASFVSIIGDLVGSTEIVCPTAGAVFELGVVDSTIVSVGEATLTGTFYAALYDPSDAYSTIVPPPSPSAAISRLLSSHPNSSGAKALYDEYMYVAFINASDASIARANGAFLNNDTAHYTMQVNQAVLYAKNASQYYTDLTSLLNVLNGDINSSGYITQSNYETGKALLGTNGTLIVNFLNALGFGKYINTTQSIKQVRDSSYAPLNSSATAKLGSLNAAEIVLPYDQNLIQSVPPNQLIPGVDNGTLLLSSSIIVAAVILAYAIVRKRR